jgi:hypothetical protein
MEVEIIIEPTINFQSLHAIGVVACHVGQIAFSAKRRTKREETSPFFAFTFCTGDIHTSLRRVADLVNRGFLPFRWSRLAR